MAGSGFLPPIQSIGRREMYGANRLRWVSFTIQRCQEHDCEGARSTFIVDSTEDIRKVEAGKWNVGEGVTVDGNDRVRVLPAQVG